MDNFRIFIDIDCISKINHNNMQDIILDELKSTEFSEKLSNDEEYTLYNHIMNIDDNTIELTYYKTDIEDILVTNIEYN